MPTASGDSEIYSDRFRTAFAAVAEASVLNLFELGERDPATHLLEAAAVYVGGGSTANLLAVWRVHGVDVLMRRAAAAGVVLAGISAGMNCWFAGSSTDSFGPLAALPDGLGLLPGSACPHYHGEPGRRSSYLRMVATGELPSGHAADDDCALLWRDGRLADVVAERPGARAFRVSRRGDEAIETPLPARLLGRSAENS